MTRSMTGLLFGCALLFCATAARADLAPRFGGNPSRRGTEPPAAAKRPRFEVFFDPSSSEARLEIPHQFVDSAGPIPNRCSGLPARLRTMFAGTALSLGIAGTFLFWTKRFRRILLAAIVSCGAVLGLLGFAVADVPAPRPNSSAPDPIQEFTGLLPASLHVKVTIVPDGSAVRLILCEQDTAATLPEAR